MRRDIFLVYLRDIRDLEMAKESIKKKALQIYNRGEHEILLLKKEVGQLQKIELKEEPTKDFAGAGCWFMRIAFLLFAITTAIAVATEAPTTIFRLFAGGTIFLGICAYLSNGNRGYAAKLHAIQLYNQKERKRMEENQDLILQKKRLIQEKTNGANEQIAFYNSEEEKVDKLLEEAYNANLIAAPYRNLAAIYYIYDYMSTSQASLEETLLHEHIENGIQRIANRLDEIIAQNQELIFHARMVEDAVQGIESNTRNILENTLELLKGQERTEENILELTQLTAVMTAYTKASTYFSAANYFSKR